ncbi:YkoF family thiamine/hydroxymethylpyrimidine-binding protein [Truepera radiovictrix]|uniref:YKOF domain protein n=1 Tax=Truepera radiovictrix (strain DSM 17093 / CIP 108686 / LMG 22925 / RQ-24) TaxID=649638 RepID=D7CSE8_TRURR|nr:YkoF family thiamine/hydroxymethylpyrimidine-binding protein [Truepera radiovictrix]ADI15368.1 YKOF domain protein [Truepera radiovictrix DSM 17093]WMT56081.1 YkoF family thiamine/hydroxymethylpyrimidine-binding protein [Truepera radiovictrix]
MIGARFSLYPMTDAFVPRILEALGALDEAPLERDMDDLSTFVSGEENALFCALEDVFGRAAASGEHVAMSLLLSRGCPGEPGEDRCDPRAAPSETPAARAAEGAEVACQFSLYPMGTAAYMDAIYDQIKAARSRPGLRVTPQHFCTRLEGPLPQVFAELRRAFDAAAERTPHVVIHATLAANSPSRRTAAG